MNLFSQKTCEPCVQLANILREKNIQFNIVYFEERPQEFRELNIRSTPTLVKNGEILASGLENCLEVIE